MQEILSGIRIIKFFAWEKPFLGRLESQRNPELNQVFRRGILNSFVIAIVFGVPVIAATLTFMIYSLTETLEADQIFPVLTWFGQLRFPLMFLPNGIFLSFLIFPGLKFLYPWLTIRSLLKGYQNFFSNQS